MDMLTVIVSSLSALLVGLVTVYVTNRLNAKREKKNQDRLLAERFAEFGEDNSEKADKLAKQFAVAFLAYQPQGAKHREKLFIPSSGRVLVGRSKQCDLVLNDRTISRQHTMFEARDSGIFLIDLHSSDGTFVNQNRNLPNHPTLLKDNDEIRIGQTTFVFHKL